MQSNFNLPIINFVPFNHKSELVKIQENPRNCPEWKLLEIPHMPKQHRIPQSHRLATFVKYLGRSYISTTFTQRYTRTTGILFVRTIIVRCLLAETRETLVTAAPRRKDHWGPSDMQCTPVEHCCIPRCIPLRTCDRVTVTRAVSVVLSWRDTPVPVRNYAPTLFMPFIHSTLSASALPPFAAARNHGVSDCSGYAGARPARARACTFA